MIKGIALKNTFRAVPFPFLVFLSGVKEIAEQTLDLFQVIDFQYFKCGQRWLFSQQLIECPNHD